MNAVEEPDTSYYERLRRNLHDGTDMLAVVQRMFTAMVTGLAAQGWAQSMRDECYGLTCAYRGEQSRRCAVGHLIADHAYSRSLEGSGTTGRDVLDALTASGWDPMALARQPVRMFLGDAQERHDGAPPLSTAPDPDTMRNAFVELGQQLGLEWPEGVDDGRA